MHIWRNIGEKQKISKIFTIFYEVFRLMVRPRLSFKYMKLWEIWKFSKEQFWSLDISLKMRFIFSRKKRKIDFGVLKRATESEAQRSG